MVSTRRFLPLTCIACTLPWFAGCRSIPAPSPQVIAPVAVPAPPASDFTIGAGMLDTWNAIGQILVRTRGVTYEGRAQMLGLYDVDFHGERFLVLARASVLTDPGQTVSTQVRTVRKDGKPDDSAAAVELLEVLQAKLPEELRLDASGARGKVHKGHIRN